MTAQADASPLRSILLATDFRPAGEEAARVAVRLASAFGSRVSLLHVLEPLPSWPVSLHLFQEQALGQLRQLADKLAAQNVTVANLLVTVGPPGDTIDQKAQELDVDLILMGAGEESRFDRFSLGPVAGEVLELAPQPVLVVRPGGPASMFKKILCPVDQSAASRRGLLNATRVARVFGGELVVLTVVPTVGWFTAAAATGRLTGAAAEYESRWRLEFEEFLRGASFAEVKSRREVRQGAPHQQILASARDYQADLIVMGATGRTGLSRVLLGSVTRRVLQDLPCSLLVVKQEDAVEELFRGTLDDIDRLMAEGRELLTAGACDTAKAKFRQVLARNPFEVGAVEGLAEAHERLGNREAAAMYRRRVGRLRRQAP
jgi:nucleotide-binding universal stress UspA family protein